MSFQLQQEFEGGAPVATKKAAPRDIAMPPLPAEPAISQPTPQESSSVDEVIEQAPVQETAPVALEESVEPVRPQETEQQKHFRNLREEKKRIERERDAYARKLQQLEEERTRQAQPQAQPQVDESLGINPDDLVEGKHLNKFQQKIQQLEQKLSQYEQRSTQMSAQAQLQAKYPDFDKVVNEENVEMLRSNYPEIAQTLNASQDLYSTAVTAYTLIKKFGIHQDDTFVDDRAKVKHNMAKPKPMASLSPQQGDSPLTRANAFASGLTEDLRKQLHKEMLEARRNY